MRYAYGSVPVGVVLFLALRLPTGFTACYGHLYFRVDCLPAKAVFRRSGATLKAVAPSQILTGSARACAGGI